MPDDHLLEAYPRSEAEGPRAQATDGPGGKFENGHGATRADAQLGMDGSFPQAECHGRPRRGGLDLSEDRRGLA